MTKHCNNLEADRALGQEWEREFCKVAAKYGRSFTPHQIGRPKAAQAYYIEGGKYHPMLLPDVTIWTRPGEHHEVKHKDPTAWGCYGLERYRLDALLWFAEETGQSVYYTIHDYSKQNCATRLQQREAKSNSPEHWVSCAITELADVARPDDDRPINSYVNGAERCVPTCFWPIKMFQPVTWLWLGEPQRDLFGRLVTVQPVPAGN